MADLVLGDAIKLSQLGPRDAPSVCDFRATDASLAIQAPGPGRRSVVAQGLAHVEVIPLKDLDIVLVLALVEAGEGLARAVLALEEVNC
jgi:hypothetical protein